MPADTGKHVPPLLRLTSRLAWLTYPAGLYTKNSRWWWWWWWRTN